MRFHRVNPHRILGSLIAATLLLAPAAQLAAQPPQFDINAQYPCCNLTTGEIAGEMTIMQCAAMPGHSPVIPGQPAGVCEGASSAPSGGDGGSELEEDPVWTVYRPNIPNGSFEEWRSGKPRGFATYSKLANGDTPGVNEYETVFESSEAMEGESSMMLKNFKLNVDDLVEGQNVPAWARAYADQIALPAGTVTCRDDCPLITGEAGGSSNLSEIAIPMTGSGPALCGAYQDRLLGSDKLAVTVTLLAGETPVAGASAFDIKHARRSRHDENWTKFRLPINRIPGQTRARPDSGILQFQVMPGGLSLASGSAGLGSAGSMVSVGSTVLLDALHFCGGMDLQITDAESSGGFMVPEDKEEDVGAIAFLNVDNDDRDGAFDFEDTDGVVGGDNELAQLLIQLPNDARGTIELRSVGSGTAKLWTGKTKYPHEEYTDLGNRLTLPANLFDNGAFLEKTLWVEGLEPSESAGDLQYELIYVPEGVEESHAETDRVALTVLAVEDMRWLGRDGNSEFDKDKLTLDPNHPLNEGRSGMPSTDNAYDRPVRVFPGRRYVEGKATDARRDRVGLEITLNVAPPRATELQLIALDPDDPSAAGDEVDREDAAADNRSASSEETGGVFEESGSVTLSLEVKEKITTTDFRVTMQPGDNFRVAAFGDPGIFEGLDNDDRKLTASWEDGARLVDSAVLAEAENAEAAEFPRPQHFLSDTLTVWRFLHVERDSMAAVAGNTLTGHSGTVTPETWTRGTQQVDAWRVTTNLNIVAKRPPSALGAEGQENSFAGGMMRFGTAKFTVVGNTARGNAVDDILILAIDESWRPLLENKSFELEDDDFRAIPLAGSPLITGPWKDGTEIPLPPDDRLLPSDDNPYFKAYVFPRVDTLPTGKGSRDFVGNLFTDTDLDKVRELFNEFNADDYEDDPDLWTVYLLGAFQGMHTQDADGTYTNDTDYGEAGSQVGAVAGEADGPGGHGALIYWASGAELEKHHESAEGWRLIDVPVHEIGHLFGAEHSDGELMSDGK
ncbi:MAG: hypothetical protein AAF560_32425, partial [Acidobacteriota bacterium]